MFSLVRASIRERNFDIEERRGVEGTGPREVDIEKDEKNFLEGQSDECGDTWKSRRDKEIVGYHERQEEKLVGARHAANTR